MDIEKAEGLVMMTEEQLQLITDKVTKIKGWLTYTRAICEGLREENERLRKQLLSDQGAQILKIKEEIRTVSMYRV